MEYRKIAADGLRSTLDASLRAGLLLLAALSLCAAASAQTTRFVELASVSAASMQAGNGRSHSPQSSEDGRYVVFESDASDLVPNDTNGTTDVFLRDLQLDTTTLISVNAAGTGSGNGPSSGASISPNGRFIIFVSSASDLVTTDTNGAQDVFVRDSLTGMKLVSANSAGTDTGNGPSSSPFITPDGLFAVFTSAAGDLAAADNHAGEDVFRRNIVGSTTVLVSVNSSGTGSGNDSSFARGVTPDGRYVLFASAATDIAGPDTNGPHIDLFRRDMNTAINWLASPNSDGTGTGNGDVGDAVMSDDGRVVAFASTSTDLVPAGGPNTGFTNPSIYAHDFAANSTTLVSEMQVFQVGNATIPPPSQPRISADGRYVFYLRVENFIGGLNRRGTRDRIFRRDLSTKDLLELPFVPTGLCDQGFNCRILVNSYVTSRDGRYVAYRQQEQPILNPNPFSTEIVVRDLVGGGTEVVNGFPGVPFNFTDPVQFLLTPGSVVAGGKVAFTSGVSHAPGTPGIGILPVDANTFEDVYFFAPPAGSRFEFSRERYTVGEDGSLPSPLEVIKARRVGYLIDTPVTVKFATEDGSAVAGSDYVAHSETLAYAPGEYEKTLAVQPVNDDVPEPTEVLLLTLTEPTGNAALDSRRGATLVITDDDAYSIQFTSAEASASEAAGSFLVTVTLSKAAAWPISVDYTTSNFTASERSDYITAAGRLSFAPGETSKSFRVFIVDDGLNEPAESFSVSLWNPQGLNTLLGSPSTTQLTINASDSPPPASNPINDTQFFVRQHYLDFLNREPDAQGFTFWTGEIESCGADAQCREVKRVNVSAAFFLSIEFQETAFLAYLTNKAALGSRPTFQQFEREVQTLQRGFVFGQPAAAAVLEANKRAYFDEFVTRYEFVGAYGGKTNVDYVHTLLVNNGLSTTVGNIFVSRLEGATPSTGTPPGVFILRRDPDPAKTTARVSLRLNSLSSAVTAVHIHGPATESDAIGPVLYTLPAGEFADVPLTLTNEQIAALNAGQLHVDVHTVNNSTGELGAQLGPARFREDVLIGALNSQTLTRAQVLRIVAESEELRRAEFNAAFVTMEYFGYLRRDPDQPGYDYWLSKLNAFNGNYIQAEMVKAFITSTEYRQRFGQP